jgi:carbamoyl-phosphate synthase/aspartate carbamoyltransferase/dihydroorotase
MATWRLPGLLDAHVHLREPGGEQKEDITSGTSAAVAGGFTMVLDMPNSQPPIADARGLACKRKLASQKALCDVGFYLGATEVNASEASELAHKAVGLKIYLDQTHGPLRLRNLAALLAHFRHWPSERPIAVHAEGLSLAIAIGLARSFDRRLHVCHVSSAEEICLIRAAKASGARLTCEVTPHHLFLTEADARRLGPYGAVKPPLGTTADVAALWTHLQFVDCIATDHAPHSRSEKEAIDPPPGMPGLETMLPLLLTAVADGRLTVERLVEMAHQAPQRIFGLPGQPETWVEVDSDARYTLSAEGLYTRCGWTPFEGMAVKGRVRRVLLRGQTLFDEGRIQGKPGCGRAIEPVKRDACSRST